MNVLNRKLKVTDYIVIITVILAGCTNRNSSKIPLSKSIDFLRSTIDLSHFVVDTTKAINVNISPIGIADDRVPGPTDYKLIATFKIRSIDTILKPIRLLDSAFDKNSSDYKDWLTNNTVKSIYEKEKFSKVPIYTADIFRKGSFVEGSFIILKDSTVCLSMWTQ